MKRCNLCKEVKPLEEFSKLHCTLDGRAYQCLPCARAKAKWYRDQRRDIYNKSQKETRAQESGFIPQLLHSAKTRAKKKGMEFDLDKDFITKLLHGTEYKCQVTGETMTLESNGYDERNLNKASLDRINSSKGYTKDNVRFVCWAVNMMKSNLTEDQFKFWIATLHKAISSQA